MFSCEPLYHKTYSYLTLDYEIRNKKMEGTTKVLLTMPYTKRY